MGHKANVPETHCSRAFVSLYNLRNRLTYCNKQNRLMVPKRAPRYSFPISISAVNVFIIQQDAERHCIAFRQINKKVQTSLGSKKADLDSVVIFCCCCNYCILYRYVYFLYFKFSIFSIFCAYFFLFNLKFFVSQELCFFSTTKNIYFFLQKKNAMV